MYSKLGIIPSMQPTHATSDMTYAQKRIGNERVEQGAYIWRTLIDSGLALLIIVLIVSVQAFPLGSDFPVETANPLLGKFLIVYLTRRFTCSHNTN